MNRKAEAGFTLVEMLIALLLLTVGLLAAVASETTNMRGTTLAGRMDEATALAQLKLEELRAVRPVTDLSNGSDTGLTAREEAGGTYTRNWVITGGPSPDSRRIEVTVFWDSQSRRHQVSLVGVATGEAP